MLPTGRGNANFQMQGGTLTAVGVSSPDGRNNLSPLEFRVYAEHRQFTEQYFMIRYMTVPPKGGTLTAVGAASPEVQSNPPPLESRVYAEN
ncbi:MAG: hypothetical protein GX456_00725 [Verrucomicrobia bacterium]|nr:hypothetical protein [Verrucomicrobiota bacterium]